MHEVVFMKLWSIQPAEIYSQIQEKGSYRFNREKAVSKFNLWPEFCQAAYGWLVLQMTGRIGKPPSGTEYPVWAWHTWDGKRKHPDLRCRQGERGEEMVCMELEVPDDQVLLSDYDAWHFVLNDFYYGDAQDDDGFDRESEWFDSLSEEDQKKEKERSWQKIFNLERRNTEWDRNGYYIQACFWELKRDYIRKARFFHSK